MALLNNIYIHVTDEEISDSVEVSSHPVEKGIETTDTVKRTPVILSISGNIVDYSLSTFSKSSDELMKASNILSLLKSWKNSGALLTYIGRNVCYNMQISDFSHSHPNTIAGGAAFSMTLQECRIAKNAYVESKKGSNVKNGGEKQVDKGDSEEVWYTVKKGDTIVALVAESNAPYKNLKREGAQSGYWGACNWVMEKNPKAFSKAGDFKTLQTGAKILLGSKN